MREWDAPLFLHVKGGNTLSKTTELIEKALEPAITSMGYRIVDVEIGKENGNKVLTVTIAHPNGISPTNSERRIGLDDCERVSRAIDPILDELDPIEDAYYLSVSSPGIDRPLKRPDDFKFSIGKEVEVRFYQPVDGKKSYIGTISAFDESADTVTIQTKEHGEVHFTRRDAALVKPVVHL